MPDSIDEMLLGQAPPQKGPLDQKLSDIDALLLSQQPSPEGEAAPEATTGQKVASYLDDTYGLGSIRRGVGAIGDAASFAKDNATPIGATVGGIVGTPFGVPGMLFGSTVGAGIGSAVEHGGLPDPVGQATEVLIEGPAGEAFGLSLVAGLNRARRAFLGKTIPAAQGAHRLLKDELAAVADDMIKNTPGVNEAMVRKVEEMALLPSEMFRGRIIAFLQQASASSSFGTEVVAFQRIRDEMLEKVMNGKAERILNLARAEQVPDFDIGSAIVDAMLDRRSRWKKVIQEGGDNVLKALDADVRRVAVEGAEDVVTKTVKATGDMTGLVNLRPLNNAFKRDEKEILDLGKKFLKDDSVKEFMDNIKSITDQHVTFETASSMRRQLNDIIFAQEALDLSVKPKKAVATRLKSILDKEIDKSLKAFDRKLRARGETSYARQTYKLNQDGWIDFYNSADAKWVKALLNKANTGEMHKAVDMLLQPRNYKRIRDAKKWISANSKEWAQLREAHLSGVIEKVSKDSALESGTQVPIGKLLSKAIHSRSRSAFGKDSWIALHGADYVKQLDEFAEALTHIQQGTFAGGRLAIQVAESGMLISLPTSAMMGPAGSFKRAASAAVAGITTIKFVDRWLTNPARLKDLNDIAKFGTNTRVGAAAAARLIADAGIDAYISEGETLSKQDYGQFRKTGKRPQGGWTVPEPRR